MRFTNRLVRCAIFYSVSALSMIGLTSGAGAQPCTAESALAKGSTWTESPPDLTLASEVAPPARHAAILKRIAPMAAMFRESYPSPQGTAADGQASIRRQGNEIDGGPWTYGYETLYKTWLCPESTRQLSLAGETGNWAYVYVNSVHSLLSEVGEMTIDGERSMVWMLARRIGDLRGETLYEAWMELDKGRGLLFHAPGRLPLETGIPETVPRCAGHILERVERRQHGCHG